MREFLLEDAKKVHEEGQQIHVKAGNPVYDDIYGHVGYDGDSNEFLDSFEQWKIDAQELNRFLLNKQVIQHLFIIDPTPEGVKTFCNKISRILRNWEEGNYPQLKKPIQGVYKPGQEYHYWRDLVEKLKHAEREIFIIDPYTSMEIHTELLDFLPAGIKCKVVTSDRTQDCQKFIVGVKKKNSTVECRVNNKIHDRLIFIDSTCIISGSSIKDGAGKKPTYLTEIETQELVQALKRAYEDIWDNSSSI